MNVTYSNIDFYPKAIPASWKSVEVYPCIEHDHGSAGKFVEQCSPDEAQFYSVYLRSTEGCIYCVADCHTHEQADNLAVFIMSMFSKHIAHLLTT